MEVEIKLQQKKKQKKMWNKVNSEQLHTLSDDCLHAVFTLYERKCVHT